MFKIEKLVRHKDKDWEWRWISTRYTILTIKS